MAGNAGAAEDATIRPFAQVIAQTGHECSQLPKLRVEPPAPPVCFCAPLPRHPSISDTTER